MSNDRRASEERRIAERVGIVESRQDRFEESVNRSLRSIDEHLNTLTQCVSRLQVFDERIARQRHEIDQLWGELADLKQHVPINSFMRDRWNKVTIGILVASAATLGTIISRVVLAMLN